MSRMSIDRRVGAIGPAHRRTLSGATMGTRYSAIFHAPLDFGLDDLRLALQAAVDEVDDQMSIWKEQSDLNRLNSSAVGTWVDIPDALHEVLSAALDIERQSSGAFNIAVGDRVQAWGFGPQGPAAGLLDRADTPCAQPSRQLELAAGRVRKYAAMTLDLNGIAKGYGVDRMAAVMVRFGLKSWLVGIDGEMRARGRKSDGEPWAVGHERPDRHGREAMGVIELQDMSVATSGNYRQWREMDGRMVSHTIAPNTGVPLTNAVASATVLAPSCMAADAWATVLMVLGPVRGGPLIQSEGFDWISVMEDGTIGTSL